VYSVLGVQGVTGVVGIPRGANAPLSKEVGGHMSAEGAFSLSLVVPNFLAFVDW
jgi:hypothetical protein